MSQKKAIEGIGVCRHCDATSVPEGSWGRQMDAPGIMCLNCGAPIYELLTDADDPRFPDNPDPDWWRRP